MVRKLPHCCSSGINICLNIDSKQVAVSVHETSSAIDCSSMKKGPIIRLLFNEKGSSYLTNCHTTPNGGYRKIQYNSEESMMDFFRLNPAFTGVGIAI